MDPVIDLPTPETEPKFRHTPLPDSCIRLLKVRPRVGYDEMRYRTEAHHLRSLPPYRALSYCWGTSTDRIPISIDGQDFNLMPNAWNALHHLDLPEETYTWMDAICVDQTNLEGRNAQVQLMGTIYETVIEVIVWLGLETARMTTAFEVLSVSPRSCGDEDGLEYLLRCSEVENYEYCRALLEFTRHEYWTRTWIIQELMLANNLTLACGKLRIGWSLAVGSWKDLHSGWKSRLDRIRGPYKELRGLLKAIQKTTFSSLATFREVFKSQQEDRVSLGNQELPNFLNTYRDSECSDVRDRIYGLLGLWNRIAEEPMQVDYTKSQRDLLLASVSYATKRCRDRVVEYMMTFEKMLGLNAADPVFQSWLRPRLKESPWNGDIETFNCHLDNNETIEIPAVLVVVKKFGTVRDVCEPMLSGYEDAVVDSYVHKVFLPDVISVICTRSPDRSPMPMECEVMVYLTSSCSAAKSGDTVYLLGKESGRLLVWLPVRNRSIPYQPPRPRSEYQQYQR